jgi:hypothetical protein
LATIAASEKTIINEQLSMNNYPEQELGAMNSSNGFFIP